MKDLFDTSASVEFYDARYEAGYMEEWDEGKKNKIREIIKSLPFPPQGTALDFGCGNGVFTNIIKECLPAWEVYGVEISKTAVANASRKYPSCRFFHADDSKTYVNKFDFLFSHHVIEHVPDLNDTFQTIDQYLKPVSLQLHVLPCGNPGSLEYNICKLKRNGIETQNNNRFFFEEPGHLRRLTTDMFEELEKRIGFVLVKEFYANQYHGAINWITKSSPRFVKVLTSSKDAVNDEARTELKKLRKQMLPLTYSQFPYSKFWLINSKWKKTSADRLKLIALFIPKLFSKQIYEKIDGAAEAEWREKKFDRNGSEMFLFFKRQS